ncbi:MAG: hypothetical protein K0Q79_887 [Flavipsychrobacter sp.]|jgi:hypothetical protein|nr:hypothetical protein [Flavipsychrobacter sp.]
MKNILLFVALLATFSPVFAQQFKIEKSAGFEEPEYGWNRLLQLKNGNTLFFHAENKEGIIVVAYDKSRKEIARKTITSQLWSVRRLKTSIIASLCEINGEAVLFLLQDPKLYRLRISSTTADVIKEDDLGSLPLSVPFGGFAVQFGNADPNNIIVEKDPTSDCYATIYFNGFAKDRSERIRVVHYNGSHTIINEAFYESPGGAFKYLRYIGCVVDGDKRVFVTTYGHNGKSDDVAARVIVSSLKVGEKDFGHKLLNFSIDFNDTKSVMLYNRNNNKIQLLTLSQTGRSSKFFSSSTKTYFLTLLSYIDPETLDVTDVKVVQGQKVSEYAQSNIDAEYVYSGLPQHMVINKDNTTTILSEESRTVTTYRNGSVVQERTFIGALGISELSDTGAELRGYAISKKQVTQSILPALYVAARSKGVYVPPTQYGLGSTNVNQFMSFDYINAPNGRYILFNDLPVNYEKNESEKKRKTMSSVSESNTICFKLGDGKIDKFFLFGEPKDDQAIFCYIQASDYNKDINTYATLLVERERRKKEAKVAWVTFE